MYSENNQFSIGQGQAAGEVGRFVQEINQVASTSAEMTTDAVITLTVLKESLPF